MTKIFEQAEYMINTIKDHYSISLQLYYIDNDPRWHQHIYICLDLIHKLQELDNYAKEMASGLLMPFAREVIANITSRIPFPPLLLPPINIRALINKQSVLIDQVREKADNKYNNPDK